MKGRRAWASRPRPTTPPAASSALHGAQEQRPPAYSAVKVDGERAYKRARRGEEVAPASRQVEVHELALTRWAPPEFDFRATVGAGTYLRALIRDAGQTLGCGAHLTRLVRTAVGPFQLADAVAAESLTPAAARNPELLVAELPRRDLSADERTAVTHGRPVPAAEAGGEAGAGAGAQVALFADGSLIAVAERAEQDGAPILKPRVVVAEP
jgi:tRNA pseudouridine55 synthase